jgi:hypothetical protein
VSDNEVPAEEIDLDDADFLQLEKRASKEEG